MGLYHSVNLVYGARITKNEMNPHLWNSVEKLAESNEFWGLSVYTLGDGDEQFLTIDETDIDSNEYIRLDKLPESQQVRSEFMKKAARELDVEIEEPGWYVLHDYS